MHKNCNNACLYVGGGIVAEGRLLDLIRRLYCFGVSLMKMDVRQESTRHTDAIDSITRSAKRFYNSTPPPPWGAIPQQWQ